MNLLSKLLALLTALQNSPALLAWLNDLFKSVGNTPSNALPSIGISENDPDLVQAFKQAPEVQKVLAEGENVPEGAQAIGLGGLTTFIALLPQLLALLKALKGGQLGHK